MTWLVTGGAGYIGAHTVRRLRAAGHRVVVLDDLSTGLARRLPAGVPLVVGSVSDRALVAATLTQYQVDGVVHLAARKSAAESVLRPRRYYEENVGGLASLLDAMSTADVSRIVLASSAAVYGNPSVRLVSEAAPTVTVNPYGETKLLGEQMLAAAGRERGLRWIALRYFNAAGADASGQIGEAHEPETHLIPLAIAAALGDGKPLTVFGDDFDTPDGTCLRDYIHVTDLAAAHVAALEADLPAGAFEAVNVGTGQGASVVEVVQAVGKALGRPTPHSVGARRAGDPPSLVANPARARELLGWSATNSSLDQIVADALRWERNPGYGAGVRGKRKVQAAVA